MGGTDERMAPGLVRRTREGFAYRLHPDVAYLGPGRAETLDLYRPAEADGQCPAVVFLHGGGWAAGDKADARAVSICETLVAAGYVVCSANYQLTEFAGGLWQSEIVRDGWPQNLYDCKTAVRYLCKHADAYGVDPERIGILGCSAGGHLALLTAFSAENAALNAGGLYREQACDVRCVVNMYGRADVRVGNRAALMRAGQEVCPEAWALASPVEHLCERTPPILILHGDQDATVAISHSQAFVAVLKEKGIPHEFVVVPGGVHSFDLTPPQMDLRPVTLRFLERHLRG